MKNPRWLIDILGLIHQKLWLRQNYRARAVFIVLFFLLLARSLPFLAPIRARDIQQNEQALEFNDRHGFP